MNIVNSFLGLLILGTGALLLSCNHPVSEEKSKEAIKQHNENLLNVNKYLVGKDASLIKAYCERQNWKMTVTQTGLWYKINNPGNSLIASIGKQAEIKYKIFLLDGTLCYSSDSLGNKKFTIGKGGVESGLEEGILFMHEKGIATFIMPPHLAYGLMGDNQRIPARSIIRYEVELIKISD